MIDHKVRRLPVIDGHRLVGVHQPGGHRDQRGRGPRRRPRRSDLCRAMSEQSETAQGAAEEEREMREHEREARERDTDERAPDDRAAGNADRPAPPGNAEQGG